MAYTQSSRDDQLQMIEDCEERSDKLSDWECRFIDDVSQYMDKGGFLSDKQDEQLEKIWNNVTEKG